MYLPTWLRNLLGKSDVVQGTVPVPMCLCRKEEGRVGEGRPGIDWVATV